jgi:hypothetical protein
MLHDPKRIRLIERWARWLAWLNLIGAVVALLAFRTVFATGNLYNILYNLSGLNHLGFWEKAPEFTRYFLPGLSALADFFFLIGISITVRFLRGYYAHISIGE